MFWRLAEPPQALLRKVRSDLDLFSYMLPALRHVLSAWHACALKTSAAGLLSSATVDG